MPELQIYRDAPEQGQTNLLFSSLAYRTALAHELTFANVSFGEDYDFADRAVRARVRRAALIPARGSHLPGSDAA